MELVVQVCMEGVQVHISVEVHKVLAVDHREQVDHKVPGLPQGKGLQIQQQSEREPVMDNISIFRCNFSSKIIKQSSHLLHL